MQRQIEQLKQEFEQVLTRIKDPDTLEQMRIKYLGRKGEINRLFKELAKLSIEEKRIFGNELNKLKRILSERIEKIRAEMGSGPRPGYEPLLPGRTTHIGHQHPLSRVFKEITTFFEHHGFALKTGPEIEYDWYNFEALNIPKHHPARDMFSSLYIRKDLMLRSHTSPIQIRVMEKQRPPIKIICPGRCYRYDPFDASHSPVFHQVEALYVDKGVSFGELKWLLKEFVRYIFGPKTRYELRPSYFPFTEPSGELAISCPVCGGDGCTVCGNSGWLEMLGCGMVHPQVLKNVKISPQKYTGYALGMGVERVAMIKYVIDDIRILYNNDLRFLEQF